MSISISIVDDLDSIVNSKRALEKWEKYLKKTAGECAFLGCDVKERGKLVGKFVKKAFGDGKIYIIPICKKHNPDLFHRPYVKPDTDFFDINE